MSEIRMRVNTNSSSKCEQCGTSYKDTREMYDILFVGQKSTICYGCTEVLFRKLLSARGMYNRKLKSPEDKKRLRRECNNVQCKEM